MKVHHVHCRICRVAMDRSTHWRRPRCTKCRRKGYNKRRGLTNEMLRAQARRYRILMAVSPYGDFEALLKALRIRNPSTRAFAYDLAIERRQSA